MTHDAFEVATQTLRVLAPEILILAVASAMMTAGAFFRPPRRVWSITAAVTLVVALVALVANRRLAPDVYAAVALNDALSVFARIGLVLGGLILLGLAHDQVDDDRAAEFFGALLTIHAGAMIVAAANELVLLFVGLELVSIPTYLILYLPRRTPATREAATKYFYLSIFSSGLLLFGLAYLYGLAGVSNLKALSYLVHWNGNALGVPQPQLGLVALVFVMAGLGFRVAAVPFHFYAPDVYQGSPAVVAALLSWVPKAIGFLAMLRVLTAVFGWTDASGALTSHLAAISDKGVLLAWVLAIATMTLGNTVALRQEDLKRLLAYSSIAHAGYLLIGIAAAFRNEPGEAVAPAYLGGFGIVFYLGAYALMTLGAFGVIIALSTPERPVETVEDLSGLGWSRPFAGLALALCLFSLTGLPPLAGFWGKFWVFSSALAAAQRPEDTNFFLWLTVIGMLNAAVGAYYYLKIVVKMYFGPINERLDARPAWPTTLAVGACASLSLLLGIVPAPLSAVSRESALAALDRPEPEAIGAAARPNHAARLARRPGDPVGNAAFEAR